MDWNHIFQTTIEGVAAAAAIALAPILVQWALKQLKKIGVQLDAEQQQKLEYFAKQAILRIEEWAAKKAGVTSFQKLTLAADQVQAATGVSQGAAIDAIHAALPTLGLGKAVKSVPLAPAGK